MVESWDLAYSFHVHKPTFRSATGETLLIAEIIEEYSRYWSECFYRLFYTERRLLRRLGRPVEQYW